MPFSTMKPDYREPEDRAVKCRAKIQQITARGSITPQERDEVCRLDGEALALEEQAKTMKDAELVELRALAATGHAVGDQPYGPTADQGDVQAFYDYIRTRQPLNLTTADTGQYVVPAPILAPLQEAARALSPITAFAFPLDLSGGAAEAELPLKSHGVASHASEVGERSETTAPTFSSVPVIARDIYSDQRPSTQWVDSVPGAESLLTRWLIEDLYETFEADVAIGAGTDRADGLFAAVGKYTVVPSGLAGALANTTPMKMITALEAKYLPGAVFLCNAATLGVMSAMAMPNSVNAPLINWDTGAPKLYGFDVLLQTSAPSIGAAAIPIALANLPNCYVIGTHRPPGILIDPYTQSATGKTRYLSMMRVGGQVWNPGACILGKSDTA